MAAPSDNKDKEAKPKEEKAVAKKGEKKPSKRLRSPQKETSKMN